jgi:hypothetical protein
LHVARRAHQPARPHADAPLYAVDGIARAPWTVRDLLTA